MALQYRLFIYSHKLLPNNIYEKDKIPFHVTVAIIFLFLFIFRFALSFILLV